MAEPARHLYDDEEQGDQFAPKPRFGAIEGGGETTEPKRGHLKSVGDKPSSPASDIKSREENEVSGKAKENNSDSKEKQALRDSGASDLSDDELFKDDGPQRKKWSVRKKAATGGIAGILGGGIIAGMFLISSGPLQFLHFAQLLQQFHFSNSDNFTDGRASKLIQYARTRDVPEQRNLDYFGNKIANHYTARLREAGIEYKYNARGRVEAVIIRPVEGADGQQEFSREGRRALSNLEAEGFDIERGRIAPIEVPLSGERAGVRRAAVGTSVDALGMNGVSNSIAARLLKIRGGVSFHPLKNIARAADEALFEWIEERRQEQTDYIEEGSSGVDGVDVDDTPADGDEPPPTAEAVEDANGAAAEGNAVVDGPETPEVKARTLRSSVLSGGAGVAGLAALTCGLKATGDAIGDVQTANVVKPLIRTGIQVIAIGAQIQSGQDINFDELGALSKSLNDPEDGTSWVEAKSIQAELGDPDTGVPPDSSAIPGTSKPLFFDQLDDFLDAIPGSAGVCDAVNSTAGDIILTVTDVAFGVSGPFGLALSGGSEVAQRILSAAFADDLIRWVAGEPINAVARGAGFGNLANYGAFLANNDRMWSMGGKLLSPLASNQLDQESKIAKQNKLKQKNLYSRVFDLKEPDSLAAKTLFEKSNFSSTQNISTAFLQAPVRSIASVFSNFSSVLTPASMALSDELGSGEYFYGVPPVGYSPEDINSEIAEDPYANAAIVEENLEDWNEDYGDCFNTTINIETGAIETNDVTSYIGREDVCSEDSDNFLRYRYYLADMTVAQSLVCLAGDDEQTCTNLGFEEPSAGGGSDATLDGVTCPATMQPHPTQTGYFRLPDAPNAEYFVYAGEDDRYGSEQLVCVIYSVGLAYAAAYPGQSQMYVGDLNASGHESHYKGIAVDIQSRGNIVAADSTIAGFNEEATVTLGKLFVDTGVMKNLWWCHQPSLDQIIAYANQRGTPFEGAKCISGHDNHFHVDILEEYALPGSFEP